MTVKEIVSVVLTDSTFNLGMYSDIYEAVSFTFGMVIVTTTFYLLISFWNDLDHLLMVSANK